MSVLSGTSTMRRQADAAIAKLRSRLRARRAGAAGSNEIAPVGEPSPLPPARQAAVEFAAQRDVEDFNNMRRLLAFTLSPDSNCVDVGAHRGAILAEMQRVAPSGRHIAFEPLPHLCELLRQTFPDVEVHQAALSNHEGESDFAYVHGAAEGWSGLLFRPLPTGDEPEVEQLRVPLRALDQVLNKDYRPALIKVDVEGAEQQVLEGAIETLRRHRPIVIFEHGLGSANAYGTHPGDIYRLLCEQAGLRIFDLDGSGPYTLAELERTYSACERVNFVARP
jgi:FkbM family methyltransferase